MRGIIGDMMKQTCTHPMFISGSIGLAGVTCLQLLRLHQTIGKIESLGPNLTASNLNEIHAKQIEGAVYVGIYTMTVTFLFLVTMMSCYRLPNVRQATASAPRPHDIDKKKVL